MTDTQKHVCLAYCFVRRTLLVSKHTRPLQCLSSAPWPPKTILLRATPFLPPHGTRGGNESQSSASPTSPKNRTKIDVAEQCSLRVDQGEHRSNPAATILPRLLSHQSRPTRSGSAPSRRPGATTPHHGRLGHRGVPALSASADARLFRSEARACPGCGEGRTLAPLDSEVDRPANECGGVAQVGVRHPRPRACCEST